MKVWLLKLLQDVQKGNSTLKSKKKKKKEKKEKEKNERNIELSEL